MDNPTVIHQSRALVFFVLPLSSCLILLVSVTCIVIGTLVHIGNGGGRKWSTSCDVNCVVEGGRGAV